MTLQQLKYVIVIADSGSVNSAAKNLYLSQPSLSSAVRDLEEEIGFELFHRSNRGVTITAEGSHQLGKTAGCRARALPLPSHPVLSPYGDRQG